MSESASEEVIRVAYKALTKKYHPDVYEGDPKFADLKMKQINEAYEVLSNPEKRKAYDASFKTTHQNSQKSSQQSASAKTPPPERKASPKHSAPQFPSSSKSIGIIVLCLLLNFTQLLHPYIENPLTYEYGFILGFFDFALVSLFLMMVPIAVGIFVTPLSIKEIKLLCVINSLAVFLISILLYATEITEEMSIGWIIAVLYYFVNKHTVFQIQAHNQTSKKTGWKIGVGMIVVLLIILISSFAGTTLYLNKSPENSFTDNNASVENSTSVENAEKAPSTGDYQVGVRTITLFDPNIAKNIYNKWQQGDATESFMRDLMDEYGSDQGGGKLHMISPGEYVDEIDTWCFDRNRRVGDVAIIENPYGHTICYISMFKSKIAQSNEENAEVNSSSLTPQDPPNTGYVFNGHFSQEGVAPLTIVTTGDGGYYFVVDVISLPEDHGLSFMEEYNALTSKISFYVRGGDTFELKVPLGTFEIYYATGDTWYGIEHVFGPDTVYHKCNNQFTFTKDDDVYNGWTIELQPVSNGNLSTKIIRRYDFPF